MKLAFFRNISSITHQTFLKIFELAFLEAFPPWCTKHYLKIDCFTKKVQHFETVKCSIYRKLSDRNYSPFFAYFALTQNKRGVFYKKPIEGISWIGKSVKTTQEALVFCTLLMWARSTFCFADIHKPSGHNFEGFLRFFDHYSIIYFPYHVHFWQTLASPLANFI